MPDDKVKLLQTADKGNRSEALLNDLRDVFTARRERLFETIRQSDGDDTEGRERCYRLLRAMDELEEEMILRKNDGDVAKHELKKLTEEDDG